MAKFEKGNKLGRKFGTPGHKGGAPKGSSNRRKGIVFDAALDAALDAYEAPDVPKGTALAAILKVLVQLALAGNLGAINVVVERKGGKVRDGLDIGFDEPITPEDLSDAELLEILRSESDARSEGESGEPAGVH